MKERNVFEILSVLDRNNRPMTSGEIREELDDLGIHLTSRMIRNYLQELAAQGFIEDVGKEGRKITSGGRDELKASFVYVRPDYVMTKICRVITDANFDINRGKGEVPVNLSFFDEKKELKVRRILEEVCSTKMFTQLMKFAYSGERLCGREVPERRVGLAVPSSVIVDEIILKNGVYINPAFLCCIIEFIDQKATRCTNFSTILDVSFDPLEMWIKYKVGSVYNAAVKGCGEVFAEYSEFPYTARTKVLRLLEKAVELFGGTIFVSGSTEKLLGIKINVGNTGVVSVSGESLLGALEEKGIETNTETVAGAINFSELEPIAPIRGEVLLL